MHLDLRECISKLAEDRYKLAGTAKLLHYLPKAASVHRIEGLGQVDEGHKEDVAMLLLANFLKLACSATPLNNQTTLAPGGDPAQDVG